MMMTTTTLVHMLTPDDVAALFGCTPDTVRERAASGELPGLKFGRDWCFPAAALYETLCTLAVEQAQQRRQSQQQHTAVVKPLRRREAPQLP
jgi:excisionase family DNA binding protein